MNNIPVWKTRAAKVNELKKRDIFNMDNQDFIVTNIVHNIIFYTPIDNPNGRSKLMSQAGNNKNVEIYFIDEI